MYVSAALHQPLMSKPWLRLTVRLWVRDTCGGALSGRGAAWRRDRTLSSSKTSSVVASPHPIPLQRVSLGPPPRL